MGNYLEFKSFSKQYLTQLLKTVTEDNYRRLISAIEILLSENKEYLKKVIKGVQDLIESNEDTLSAFEKIDISLNILFSELIHNGFSKGFLYKLVYGIFVNSLNNERDFKDHFRSFKTRILLRVSEYQVIFRIDTSAKVYESISAIENPELKLCNKIDDFHLGGKKGKELNFFNVPAQARKFIQVERKAHDYLAALKSARNLLSEYLDVINLGLSDEFLRIHNRVLVIDLRSPDHADFQNNVNILDGKYKVEKEYYLALTNKVPAIISNPSIQAETKGKLKSSIRYLRLGNQSTEVEHKFLNYWIGLEYLFSNYESQNTVSRIKSHFINAHALAYVKRNLYSFKKSFTQVKEEYLKQIPSYSEDYACLCSGQFYQESSEMLKKEYPLLAYRSLKLHKWFFNGSEPNAKDYLYRHMTNLEIHFTRIYRIRNEIIHDAATDTNNEQITSNLRYYLTFILNEIIDFLSRNPDQKTSVSDYFILNEIQFGNIAQNGFLLNELLENECSIDFIS